MDLGQIKLVNDDTGKEKQTSKIIVDQVEYQFALRESFSFSLFWAEFGAKARCPTIKNMNITRLLSLLPNCGHGWGHYFLEFMENEIF